MGNADRREILALMGAAAASKAQGLARVRLGDLLGEVAAPTLVYMATCRRANVRVEFPRLA